MTKISEWTLCPNCNAGMHIGERCPECDHDDYDRECPCLYCRYERLWENNNLRPKQNMIDLSGLAGDDDSFSRLCTVIATMHKEGWIHRKRNYPLNEATVETALTHVIEEFSELQAAVLAFKHMKIHDQARGERHAQYEEAADLIGCVIHLFILIGLDLNDVWNASITKMFATFHPPSESPET